MELVSKAVCLAAEAFDRKKRKGSGTPAVLHSLEAASIASLLTKDENIIAAAVLHDVVEDTDISLDEIRRDFGPRVAELVEAETENKRKELPAVQTWHIRKQESIDLLRNSEDEGIKIIFLSDKLSNIRSIYSDMLKEGDTVWQKFNQKDPEEYYWYYKCIAEALIDLKDSASWQELSCLISRVFKEETEK